MNRKIPVSMLIGLVMLAAVAAFNVSYVVIWNAFNDRLATLNAREAAFIKLSEIAAYVDEYYVEEYDPESLLDGAAEGYVRALPDESSYYISSDEVSVRESADENGFTGIGIIGCQNRKYSGICVLDMYEGSTAAEFGIERFDVITKVDGESVSHLSYEGAMERIRGEEGTSVELTVYRERTDETLTLHVRRGAVISERSFVYRMLDGKIGYIDVDNFDTGTDVLFLSALEELKEQGMTSLIIDVRMNPGGYMDVMTNMVDPLMPEGVIYSQRHGGGEATNVYSDEEALELPIVLLVNEYTSGAGEYFAAALQASGSATVIGSTTAGFGYAQSQIELSDGSAMVLSSIEYYTPEREPLQETGVVPDHRVSMSVDALYDLLENHRGEDIQLNAAVEFLEQA